MDLSVMVEKLNFANVIWQIATPLIFSLLDIVTGYIQALINKNVDSQKMRNGLLHKFLIVIILVSSFIIQFAFNINYISSFVCVYIVLMEISSIIENMKKAGIDLGKLGNIVKEKSENQSVDVVIKKGEE